MRTTFFYTLLVISLCPLVSPDPYNQTIDDQFGDSVTGRVPNFWSNLYSPWDNETCGVRCVIKPDVTQVYKGTYSAATYHPYLGSLGVGMQFTGKFLSEVDKSTLNDSSRRALIVVFQELRFMCSSLLSITRETTSQH